MASFLDTGLVGLFSLLFSFLLVYAIVWGLLSWRKPFGDNKGVYGIIALMSAFLMIISEPTRIFIEFVTPWFLAFMVAMFLFVIVFSVFAEVEWIKVIKDPTVYTLIIIILAVILMAGLGYVFGQMSLEAGGFAPDGSSNPNNGMPVMGPNGTVYQDGQQMIPQGQNQMPTSQGQIASGGPTSTGNFQVNLVNTLIHPKVLGLMLVFLLSSLVVYFLSRPAGGL